MTRVFLAALNERVYVGHTFDKLSILYSSFLVNLVYISSKHRDDEWR